MSTIENMSNNIAQRDSTIENNSVDITQLLASKVTIIKNPIKWNIVHETEYGKVNENCDISLIQVFVRDKQKKLMISYCGHFSKPPEVTIKDVAENVLAVDNGNYLINIPYDDLSDISTLYFCCHDKQIKITVQ